MTNKKQTKQEYVDAWNSHINVCKTLCWTPTRELSKEVETTIEKLKELVVKVAEDKELQGGKK